MLCSACNLSDFLIFEAADQGGFQCASFDSELAELVAAVSIDFIFAFNKEWMGFSCSAQGDSRDLRSNNFLRMLSPRRLRSLVIQAFRNKKWWAYPRCKGKRFRSGSYGCSRNDWCRNGTCWVMLECFSNECFFSLGDLENSLYDLGGLWSC